MHWSETRLESSGEGYNFNYKTVITNSFMDGYTFPTASNILTPYWPSYIAPLSISYSSGSVIQNLTFKDFIFSLPADTFGSYNAMISLSSNNEIAIDSITYININMNMRDNSGGSLIGNWSNGNMRVSNISGTGLSLGNGLGEHETSGATYSNIYLEENSIPGSGMLTVGFNRYNHAGNIEKLTNATFKKFSTGIQSNTAGGIDVTNFLISNTRTAASLGVVWVLRLYYGGPYGARWLKHGTIDNSDTGYDLRGTATITEYDEPLPLEWGLSTVYSEDVTISANNRAISSGGYDSGHRFYGLNDIYSGVNYDVFVNRNDFHINLINSTFSSAKTTVTGTDSFVKDYRLVTVEVLDQLSQPISDAIITITPQNNGEVVCADGAVQTLFQTDGTGRTSTASDEKTNSPALLKWKKEASGESTGYTYKIVATKSGRSAEAIVSPGAVFDYRTYGNTTTLTVDLTGADITPPSAVTDLSMSTNTITSITLGWMDSPG